MTKRLIILLASLVLVVPFLFYGCSGDDGAAGPRGATGDNGAAGSPGTGVVADETCVLCHTTGKLQNVASMHRAGQTAGSMTVVVNSVEFGTPSGDNVPVTVNFTFAATDSAGANITNQIDLTAKAANTATIPSNDNLAYISFYLAKLVPGTGGSPDEWNGYLLSPGVTGSGPFRTADRNGVNGAVFTYDNTTGVGSYTFRTSAVRVADGYVDNAVTRAAVQVSGVPVTLFTSDPYFNTSLRRPVANGWRDVVSGVGVQTAAPGAGYPVKNDVAIESCNKCHDPLGIHGGSRREVKLCQVCHNAKVEVASHPMGGGYDNGNLLKLVHGVHQGWNLGSRGSNTAPPPAGGRGIGDFSEVAYPQAINNCTTCHSGPAAADNTYDNWKNKPTIVGCTSCHTTTTFVAPATHTGGVRAATSCATCHDPDIIVGYHAAKEGAPPTPNNPTLAGTLKAFEYGINSVTVDNTNTATIKFWIKNLTDNVYLNLGNKNAGDNVTKRPTGYSTASQPSFLFAYTLPQDGVSAPADYNNLGRSAGQPESVSILGLTIVSNDNAFNEYTVTRANAFPAGAKMRAVALQGYFTQTSGGTDAAGNALDNVARHTVSFQKAVTGDAVRRNVIKLGIKESGYDNVAGVLTPVGCMECHQVFEGHGGSRVNNVQVCVMCHNPNLTSSGRTILDNITINPDITALYGSNPLLYPEVTNNFKSLIHGLHSGSKRVNEFVDIRNRLNGVLLRGSEVTYPGELSHCTKCHVGTTYQNVQVANGLLTTEKVTTGVAGETRAQINTARGTVPNATDLVDSPTVSACGYCHDTPTAVSHFLTQGGEVKSKRADALVAPPLLLPDVLSTP